MPLTCWLFMCAYIYTFNEKLLAKNGKVLIPNCRAKYILFIKCLLFLVFLSVTYTFQGDKTMMFIFCLMIIALHYFRNLMFISETLSYKL